MTCVKRRRDRMESYMSRRRMHEKDAIILAGVLGLALLLLSCPLWGPMIWNTTGPVSEPQAVSGTAGKKEEKQAKEPVELPVIDESGMTLSTRINPPSGYERVEAGKDSLAAFLRDYPLKKSTGVVKTWDGNKRENQSGVQAVFKLPLEKADLQRSAGSIMRVYAEYFWSQKKFDKISFQFNDGFEADYLKWQEGFRIRMDATGAIWVNGGSYDETEDTFRKYMSTVLTYTSAESLEKECKKIKKAQIQTGDIFLQTGTNPDAAMVVDVCENKEGQKAFLLAKGGNPAQQFHLLTNPAHEEDPWYYVEEFAYPLETPEGSFEKGTLYHPSYLDEEESDTAAEPTATATAAP